MQNNRISESIKLILQELLETKNINEALNKIEKLYSNPSKYRPENFSPINV